MISAKEILADIKGGMDDVALMKKFRLSEETLPKVLKKLMDRGLVKQQDLEKRSVTCEKSTGIVHECPACGVLQTEQYDECPLCGAIASKWRKPKIPMWDFWEP